MNDSLNETAKTALLLGDRRRREGDLTGAVEAYLAGAEYLSPVPADLCLAIARTYLKLNDTVEALRWATAVPDADDDFPSWLAAAALVRSLKEANRNDSQSQLRIAIAGSFTTAQLTAILPLAALRQRMNFVVWEGGYGQYRQAILDPQSALYASRPDVIVVAVHDGELALPPLSDKPREDVAAEITRWTTLWQAIRHHSAAQVVQFNFATPAEVPLGHLAARLPGSREAMIQALNAGLGIAAGTNIDIVDCERLSSLVGKERWVDPRYWHLSKQAISLQALPMLARHLTAVIAGRFGLSRKCLVLDLDNTLWGGIVGEDGLSGIRLGGDSTGEAFVAFQHYIRRLKEKGVILAVCSKNNERDAREPFERHPEMLLKLDDFAVFIANWEPKSDNLRRVATALNVGLDSLVFVDDNPVECASVRRALPEVDVIALPPDPSNYVRVLSSYLMFESARLTAEDTHRADQYRARAAAQQLESAAGSLEEFWGGLDMTATITAFSELDIPRVLQLIGKTNQFNLTTRRHGSSHIESFMQDPGCLHFSVRLRDRYGDHGLVGVMIALQAGAVFEIDTWLMSCRVIGRTLERTMLEYLCAQAQERGVTRLRGRYYPTEKNALVKDLYPQMGFDSVGGIHGEVCWEYDLTRHGPIRNEFIRQRANEEGNEYARATGTDLQRSVQ